MSKIPLLILLLVPSLALAKEKKKTVAECAKDLNRAIFALGDKKYEQICRKYPQEVIECAMEDFRGRSLGRTFDNALEDCNRPE